jgi:hypothetical protein
LTEGESPLQSAGGKAFLFSLFFFSDSSVTTEASKASGAPVGLEHVLACYPKSLLDCVLGDLKPASMTSRRKSNNTRSVKLMRQIVTSSAEQA